MDMHNEPSQEAVDREIAYRKNLEKLAAGKISQNEPLVVREVGLKPTGYMANKD